MVCRKSIWTGCAHPACGHMHKGACWKKAHSADAKIRAKLKKKRSQPEIALGDKAETRRVKAKRRPRQPIFEEGEGEEEE